MWIFLSLADCVGERKTDRREFPFDTSGTTKELYFKVYAAAVLSTPKFAATIPTHSLFTGKTLNAFESSDRFVLDTSVYSAKDGEASQPTGMVLYKFGAATWGGSCCTNALSCADTTPYKRCDFDNASAKKLKLLSTNQNNRIAHSFFDTTSTSKMNAMFEVSITALADMPAHLTTVRGRGGLGSANQKLVDMFWIMTSNIASSPSIQALLHFYVAVTTTKTDAQMNVIYGFPINVYSGTASASKKSENDGAVALSTGMKLYIAVDAVPVADYYGFYVPRMTPFFKTTGGNEIDVVVSTARTV